MIIITSKIFKGIGGNNYIKNIQNNIDDDNNYVKNIQRDRWE